MIIMSAEDVRANFPMRDAIPEMTNALRSYAEGRVTQPLRTIVSPSSEDTVLGVMPCHVAGLGYGVKIIMHKPDNQLRKLSTHIGTVMVYSPETGELTAVLDGGAITAIRTAAVSAVATRTLARADAGDLAILGSGQQARTHLEAIAAVRVLRRVRVWSRSSENARAFSSWAASDHNLNVEVTGTPREALHGADIVCAVTASRSPLIEPEHLSPGAHVNAVGASIRGMKELAPAAVARCAIFVDSLQSALSESSDICDPISEGLIDEKDIKAEIGDVLIGKTAGRSASDEITLFKSLGLAVQDVVSGFFIADRASEPAKEV
jgi:ornithine cyclodeaminase/alanine dehydrogenase-like protein (mu-crystallin family)